MTDGAVARTVPFVTRLDISLLGPLEIRRDGTPVTLPRGKLRALFATLAVREGRPVPVDDIIGRVWDDDPPPSAAVTVRGDVKRLRRLLDRGCGESLIVCLAGAYQLRIAPADLDIRRFSDTAACAEAARDPGARYELLRRALALWHGPPLHDVPSDALRRDLVPALCERRLDLLCQRIAHDLAGPRPQQVLAELRGLVAEHPLHEVFWEQLIQALRRAGRHAEALQAYGACRDVLAEQLGVEPGPRLRTLHRNMLIRDAAAVDGPVPGASRNA
jgi:DNA-binding SARP family transcriptional activator